MEREAKKIGGSLGIIIGKFDKEQNNIEEGDILDIEIVRVIKKRKEK